MTIDTAYFHKVCIDILYGSLVLLTFVAVERLVYYALLALRIRKLGAVLHGSGTRHPEKTFRGRDLITLGLADYILKSNVPEVSRERIEDLSSNLYIKIASRISARLWMLDTIVTAAPLLGLLGTILGIMDTFNALSSGGVSDPAAVSRGIAAALLATAIGIGTALYALMNLNLLRRIEDHLTDGFKRLLLASQELGSQGVELVEAARREDGKGAEAGFTVTPIAVAQES